MTNLDSILRSRDMILLTKFCLIKAMVFPVVMYSCKSWAIKKAEHWKIDAFKLWCWRRFLKIPWIARRSNQSILKEINPEYSLEVLLLKLKLQYFGHLMWPVWLIGKDPGCWERLRAKRERGWQRVKWLESITDSMDMNSSKLWKLVEDRGAFCVSVHGVSKSQTRLSDSTTVTTTNNLDP